MKLKMPLKCIALLSIGLQSCAILTGPTNTNDKQPLISQPTATLSEWQLTGKLGITTASQANSVNLRWHQKNAQYQLTISGPLGTGTAKITGNSDHIKMRQGSKTYFGTPEELGLQLLGAPLPVNAISWWARGLPAPNYPSATNIIIDAQGAPQRFEQAGWQLRFSHPQTIDNHRLPKKVTGQLGDLSFKLAISKWDIPDN